MKNSNLIVMLTCHDVTVQNARDVFASCRDLDVSHWGFKDNGISLCEMRELAKDMKSAGKKICFETLALTEAECLASAEHAAVLGVDFLIGGDSAYSSSAQGVKLLTAGVALAGYDALAVPNGHPGVTDVKLLFKAYAR